MTENVILKVSLFFHQMRRNREDYFEKIELSSRKKEDFTAITKIPNRIIRVNLKQSKCCASNFSSLMLPSSSKY